MCTTYDENPRRRGSQKQLEEGRRRQLSSDEPYKLKEKIDDVVSMPSEGPQEGPTTQDQMLSGTAGNDVPMEQG